MITFDTAEQLAAALRRAAAAHGRHEEELGHADEGWPEWYAAFMLRDPGPVDSAGAADRR
ncbi:hypothetical protein [Dactylosporangium matsuzakiense]|uniref:Glyoxalase n=1 Tax=Dactylosporangium matsuzakiense TaxID=53360 RepID=A0A9W6KKZ9_9ACTN|nr:hypothetical protein [Dactylosporangium matsuzakiense]UWZ41497.1 hypothetical protein Dmats_27975 [Dactylosporangium matsuzakiense]GLL02449.1 hypothetical protein GCM10017581_041910 [Dactylosporangium matsuzakiense]